MQVRRAGEADLENQEERKHDRRHDQRDAQPEDKILLPAGVRRRLRHQPSCTVRVPKPLMNRSAISQRSREREDRSRRPGGEVEAALGYPLVDERRERVDVAAGHYPEQVEGRPRLERSEEKCHEDRRFEQRQRDPEEGLHRTGAIDPCRLMKLIRDRLKPGEQQQSHKGGRRPDVDGDDGEEEPGRVRKDWAVRDSDLLRPVLEDSERVLEHQAGENGGDRQRKGPRDQNERSQHSAPAETTVKDERHRHRDQKLDPHGDHGENGRVLERLNESGIA